MKIILATKKISFLQKQYLSNAGFMVLEDDFITIEYIDFDKEVFSDFLIFTSKNAVKSVLRNTKKALELKKIPAICVGNQTREYLEKEGWEVVFNANSSIRLAEMIVKNIHPNSKITFFNGNLRKNDLPRFLAEHNFSLEEVEVYKTQFTPCRVNVELDAVLFFSPSGVKSFLSQNKLSERTIVFCIGESTAEIAKNNINRIVIADETSIKGVIIQCVNFFKKE